jgi:V-type H+-transporting ATPase subunit d
MLDKILYEEEVRQLINTYEQQFHYGVFYAYMRLRWVELGECTLGWGSMLNVPK